MLSLISSALGGQDGRAGERNSKHEIIMSFRSDLNSIFKIFQMLWEGRRGVQEGPASLSQEALSFAAVPTYNMKSSACFIAQILTPTLNAFGIKSKERGVDEGKFYGMP